MLHNYFALEDKNTILQSENGIFEKKFNSKSAGEQSFKKDDSSSKPIQRNKSKGNFICTFRSCNEKFSCQKQLFIHLKLHDNVQPFICETCGKVCRTQSRLDVHEDKHKNDIKPKCLKCDRTFSTRSAFKKHIRIIHENRPFKCPVCETGFEKEDYLSLHLEKGHSENAEYDFDSVNERSSVKKTFDNDLSYDSIISNKNAYCNSEIAISQSSGLSSNSVSSSLLINSYSCHLCSSVFPTSSYLQQHMSVHYHEKQPCHICGLSYSSFRDLALHLRSHTSNEQAKTVYDFSGYTDSSYFTIPFSVSTPQNQLPTIHYPSQSLSHQFISSYQQPQQPASPLYFSPHTQQSATYSPSLQYVPFYSDKRGMPKEDSSSKYYESVEYSERNFGSHARYY